jgi:hypothetical protein
VAVNRCLALYLLPPRYDALVTRARLILVYLFIWCFSLALHLLIHFLASHEVNVFLSAWLRLALILTVWIVTAVMYFVVFRKIKSYSPPLALSPSSEQASSGVYQSRHLLVTFCVILVTSFICWAPYIISQIIEYFMKTGQATISEETFKIYTSCSVWLYFLSPAINPLIYWWRLDGFRAGFKALFCRCLVQPTEELRDIINEDINDEQVDA